MKVILVTSQFTYVKGNYYYLLKQVTDKNNLPENTEISCVVFIKTFSLQLLLKVIFLMFIGARHFSLTLLKNMLTSFIYDPRIRLLKSLHIPILKVKDINSTESLCKLRQLQPDLIVNLRTRNIYKKEILSLPEIGCINIHHGILPDNRGTMCDLWAWVENRPVGFSIHWMNEEIDGGNIIITKQIDLSKVKTYPDIPRISSIAESEQLLLSLIKISQSGYFFSDKNISMRPKYTKNPSLKQIRLMTKTGFRL
ncbi:formyltransferase family protein [Phosphitispora fastidiosa]|uniref:formyltransferase family protein n=1 Tax=Phosphitispora fastidiosa TaxID=2837202 RepID=UPI001E5CE405|nr:formyltransferase family protein [Phosphitispora fastidiosa]MBU7006019.1 folate-dependent phosphoribosylglycinamide formyltransferase PurN [Phosphitispora fastidiosa]